jgi:hypothetical protein
MAGCILPCRIAYTSLAPRDDARYDTAAVSRADWSGFCGVVTPGVHLISVRVIDLPFSHGEAACGVWR